METTPGVARNCDFIRGNGLVCGGFALKNSRYCYFHSRAQQSRSILSDVTSQRRYEYATGNKRTLMSPNANKHYDDLGVHLFQALNLPPLTDASSCLTAINAVTQALATHQISPRTANALKGLIRTAIMLHERYLEEQEQAREHPELAISENLEQPPHHMSPGCFYDADGELVLDPNHPHFGKKEPQAVEPISPAEEMQLERAARAGR
jgi:hypothetical protein